MNNKKYIILIFSLLLSVGVMAQPSAVKNAAKAVFSLTTFKSDGSVLATGHGVFVGSNGEAVSAWKPFLGADSAVVIDAQGKTYTVEVITDCSELYDVCKFKVSGTTPSAQPATSKASAGSKVWLVSYAVKKAKAKQLSVSKVETFMEKYGYYLFPEAPSAVDAGCPVVDAQGRVLGLIETAAAGDGAFAVDMNYPMSFKAQNLSLGNTALNATGIRAELPDKADDALLVLMMAANDGNERNYRAYIDDYIRQFPTSVNGYAYRARLLVDKKRLADADAVMQEAIKKVTNKDEAHYELSRIIYNQQIYSPDSTFTQWSLAKSAEEARKAYSIKAMPAYRNQEGMSLFSQQKYEEALKAFESIKGTDYHNSELFLEIAQCKMRLKAPQAEIIENLDSAVALCPKPLTNVSAPYFLARGMAFDNAGDYRKAIDDYNVYDTLMAGRASADFYYSRYVLEMKLKRYQPALNDLAHAAFLSPNNPVLLAELSSQQLRFNMNEEAQKTAEMCLARDPKNTDAMLVKGLALIKLKKKTEGLAALQQAQDLGDSRAEDLIKKYK